jgi:hypothetical protein
MEKVQWTRKGRKVNERQRRVKEEMIKMDGMRLEERDAKGGTAALLRWCCDNLPQGPSAMPSANGRSDSMVELLSIHHLCNPRHDGPRV